MTYNETLKKRSFLISILLVMLVYLPINYHYCIGVDDLDLLNRLASEFGKVNYFNLFYPKSGVLYFRPLLELTFHIDYAIWGKTIGGYHFANYYLHILNAGLLYNIALKFFTKSTNKAYYASISMLIFALNPLTCESVAWISGRSDIAGTFFSLLAINCLFIKNNFKFFFVPLFALLGLFCKENAFSVFPLIISIEAYLLLNEKSESFPDISFQKVKKIMPGVMIWALVLLIPISLYVFLRTNGAREFGTAGIRIATAASSTATVGEINISGYLKILPAIAFYFKKLIVPFPLNFSISTINYPVYSVLFVLYLFLNIYWLKTKQFMFVCGGILLIFSFLPSLPIAVGGVAWVPFAERYLYLSLCVWGILISLFLNYLITNKKITPLIANVTIFLILVISFTSTLNREQDWASNEKLLFDTTKKISPDNFRALYNYAISNSRKDQILYLLRAKDASKNSNDKSMKANIYRAIAHYYAIYYQPPDFFKIKGIDIKSVSDESSYIQPELSENELASKLFENIDTALSFDAGYTAYTKSAVIVLKFTPKSEILKYKVYCKAIEYYKKAYEIKPNAFQMYRVGGLERLLNHYEAAAACFHIVISKFPESEYAGYAAIRLRKFKEEGLIK